ncbi:CehA/McbA family metallohydrolase [Polyangium fumosum]|uniref:Polymerase/histidinol phosphatase N-terminal domain-containing protein n=1 Tax=Polyangium fumosum TaxID=889272 RepID=A0A4U1J4V9_9BACT|nr:CehA/McbA family metallohydrolase [Polyangium fumosum]TKD02234.1 hypothetical protein E8A74_29100 [Polyangium fumosum]
MRFSSPFVLAFTALAASCAAAPTGPTGGAASDPPEEPPAPVVPREVPVEPPSGALGTAAPVVSREAVPLKGLRVDARPGDFVLSHAGRVAVVSARGHLVDYGPEGGADGMVSLQSILQIGLGVAATDVVRVELVGEKKNVVRVDRAVRGQPLSHVSFYFFGPGDALWIESVAVAAPEIEPVDPGPVGAAKRLPALAVTLGENIHWGNVPTWVEGAGPVASALHLRTEFVARHSLGTAYALCSAEGPLLARFGSPEYGFFEAAFTGERVVPVVHAGASERRRVAVTLSDRSSGDAALALPCRAPAARRRVSLPTIPVRGARVELARCDAAGRRRVYAELAADERMFGKTDRAVDLPEGCIDARLVAPGHAPGPWIRVESIAAEVARAKPSAGRLRIAATEGGKPIPARLLVRGKEGTPDPDWGDEPLAGAALNVVYLDRGERDLFLPPGKYHVALTRGFSYTAHEEDIEVAAGRDVSVRAKLERVVDTKGFVSADLHLHAEPSPDAPAPLAERVRSLVSVGVDVAVATDHNAVTDYGPTIREMGLAGDLMSIVGDEVTSSAWGHFNVFPLLPASMPLPWIGVLPAEIFAAARAQKPYGTSTLLQVNHPRWGGIGYFELLRLDTDDLKGSLDRSPIADMGFDLLEVYNGDHSRYIAGVEPVLRDWYVLLDAGFRVVGTGNSDSHKLVYHEAGLPRNMVFVGNDGKAPVSEAAFVDALRKGNVSVSGGPFVRIEVGGKAMGETIAPGEAEVVVRVDAPPWIEVDRIELVKRGKTLRTFPVAGRKGPIEQRSRETFEKGDWILAIARGNKPMDAYVPGVPPLSFTNPVFVR